MRLASLFIADIQDDFEGGTSLSVSWDRMLARGVKAMLRKVRPKTLVRQVPIYGGLSQNLIYYYSPADILVPTAIYANDGRPLFAYRPPKSFNDKSWETDVFTIETVNGVQMIKLRREINSSIFVIDEMDTVGTITGTVTPTLNTFNYLTGSASLQATFTDAGLYYGDTFATAEDITDYLEGIAIVPFSTTDTSKIASVQLQLFEDGANYITLNSTTEDIGETFKNNWNYARFSMANGVDTGTPDVTNITEWRLTITTTTGETAVVLVDRLTLQKSAMFYLEYVSNRAFVDGTTGLWKDTVDYTEDYVNVDQDLDDIVHYETCLIVDKAVSYGRTKGAGVQTSRFLTDLASAYQAYWIKFPSQEEPLSYGISPEIEHNPYDEGSGYPISVSLDDTTDNL